VRVPTGLWLTEDESRHALPPIECDDVRYESVGPRVPNTEAGSSTPRGRCHARERGELLVRGPQVMEGLLQKPEATARCLDRTAGSAPATSRRGRARMVRDRRSREGAHQVQGLQVAPAELEAVLLAHPAWPTSP
jgi:4-coumarate--CoA ligase